MNVTIEKDRAYVVLSRRNIDHLTRMLDNHVGGSLRRRDEKTGDSIFISVEEDDVHYKDRPDGPGPGAEHLPASNE